MDVLYPPHFSRLQPDLDAMRVRGRVRQDILNDPIGELTGTLMLLLHDRDAQPWLDVISYVAVHFLLFR